MDTAYIQIVDFSPQYADAFRTLNETWIRQYFEIEASDLAQISNPEKSIISDGGHILVAISETEPVGVVALIPHGEMCFEMAKMAVSPEMQGSGIGRRLAEAAIARAKKCGANRIFLESNTRLGPAIALYRKLGFRLVEAAPSTYSRVDIQMELIL